MFGTSRSLLAGTVVAAALCATAPLVQAVYERHGFTLARATESHVIQQVRDMLAQAMQNTAAL